MGNLWLQMSMLKREREKRSQINSLTFYFRELEKEKQTKFKANIRKEIKTSKWK